MPNTTLGDIIAKVRLVTGRQSPTQLTDDQIKAYVNNYYLYDLPEYLRTFRLRVPYSFVTQPNVDSYNFPFNSYTSVEPAAYSAGYRVRWYQNVGEFYAVWPRIQSKQQVSAGNGTAGIYTGTLSAVPCMRASVNASNQVQQSYVLISANFSGTSLQLVDGPPFVGQSGTLYDIGTSTVRGSVNYVSGALSFSFSQIVPASTAINVQYTPYGASRPTDMLFYNNQFVMRPIPDDCYVIDMIAYILPTELISTSDDPVLKEWWQLLAYGASTKVYADFPDPEGMQHAQALLHEQLDMMESRTCKQLSNQRAQTIFSSLRRPNFAGYFGTYQNQ